MVNESVEETPFNMAMLYYMELHQLRQFKSRAVIDNDMSAYFDALEEIFISISFKLSKAEKEDLNEKFKGAYNELKPNVSGGVAQKFMSLSLLNAKKTLKDIDMQLIGLMHKYKMIFPQIETTKGIAKQMKKYNLGGKGE